MDPLLDVKDLVIYRDKFTNKSRGFAHVLLASPSHVEVAMGMKDDLRLGYNKLNIDRVASQREKQESTASAFNRYAPGRQERKLFVGNLSASCGEETLLEVFREHGVIEDTVIMRDRNTQKSRNFGYLTSGAHTLYFFGVPSLVANTTKPQKSMLFQPLSIRK